ncbi:DUF3310 domain-containing protein [Staphylococcus epidermidis]|jgi:hypothetical protein|uniref:DUF3310 domain-containing protein n=1 Tax=Staphylococcus epidermidis TaxID=1282 RepID=UPI0007E4BF5D|nr:DUF3310 domain-containing protein [Staphylococcus epidermidis]NAM70085.1 DUF3310 domain-containing protein [Staphylococcus epidermidis]NAM83046.1 DUF3310 domain-containing protein [Staphylococcus epidermidis]NAM85713.1 DUF3310 domain-containing protein [Staphylococcus epidermidis]OAX07337.1 hypothetical protein A9J98_01875 [Staphylococcus epidermidis]
MSVKDLNRGDRIRIHEINGIEITVQIKNVYRLVQSRLDMDKWVADVEAIDGRTWTIDDRYDFYSLANENEGTEKTLDDKVNHPSHYQGRKGIDVIEFLYQQLTFEEFKGFMKGNMIKYPVRAGRKDNELADIKKARDYADRLIEKLEVEGNGI